MHFKFKNVNDAFIGLIKGINSGIILTTTMPSRYGEVLKVDEPVIVTYKNPRERVLFNESRDANPFFHLYESMWMLVGRQDVAPLSYYNSQIDKIASDDGKIFHGAYGYRWRHHFGYDQLQVIIDELRANPWSRRCVLSMWDANSCGGMTGHRDDLHVAVTGGSKDVPCNVNVFFLVEQGKCLECHGAGTVDYSEGSLPDSGITCPKCKGTPSDQPHYLTMTVMNRSNDMIWGMLGANVVHLSFLQEYLAAYIGLDVGDYNQITNNLHVYTKNWKPEEWKRTMHDQEVPSYSKLKSPTPLVKNSATFDSECQEFVERHSRDALAIDYTEPFLQTVAQPMSVAYHHYKRSKDFASAIEVANSVASDDWRIAAINWLQKRRKKHESRSKEPVVSS